MKCYWASSPSLQLPLCFQPISLGFKVYPVPWHHFYQNDKKTCIGKQFLIFQIWLSVLSQSADYNLIFEIFFLNSIIICAFVHYFGLHHPSSYILFILLYLLSGISPSVLTSLMSFLVGTLLGFHLLIHLIELKLLIIILTLPIMNFIKDFLLKSLDHRLETST